MTGRGRATTPLNSIIGLIGGVLERRSCLAGPLKSTQSEHDAPKKVRRKEAQLQSVSESYTPSLAQPA